nr:hypothetical protein CFP56_57048 [Quercus suber]
MQARRRRCRDSAPERQHMKGPLMRLSSSLFRTVLGDRWNVEVVRKLLAGCVKKASARVVTAKADMRQLKIHGMGSTPRWTVIRHRLRLELYVTALFSTLSELLAACCALELHKSQGSLQYLVRAPRSLLRFGVTQEPRVQIEPDCGNVTHTIEALSTVPAFEPWNRLRFGVVEVAGCVCGGRRRAIVYLQFIAELD